MELSLLPADWENITISEFCGDEQLIVDGPFGSNLKNEHYVASGIPVLSGGNISGNTWKFENIRFISESKAQELIRCNARVGDLLTVKIGSVGFSAQILDLDEYEFAIIPANLLRIRINRSDSDPTYLKFFLQYEETVKTLQELGTSTAQPALNLRKFRKLHISRPPHEEQKVIAEALSDIDELIRITNNELSKIRNVRMSLLQSLAKLFSTTTPLSKILDTPVTDGPHLTPKFLDTGVPFLSVNNISDNRIDLSSLRYISKEDDLEFSKKCKPRIHDILLGKAASVGKVAIVENDFDFNIWSPLAMIRVNNDYNPFFIFYCFQTSNILEQISLLTNSSSQGNIGMGDIEKILVPILDISLQDELATRLRDFDKRIESLSRLVTKYEWLKQGMMHDLLTGRVRLV